jgi:hypothetical protein
MLDRIKVMPQNRDNRKERSVLLAEHEPAMLVIELPKPHGTKFPRKIRFSEM